jgi:hypothetical protein
MIGDRRDGRDELFCIKWRSGIRDASSGVEGKRGATSMLEKNL